MVASLPFRDIQVPVPGFGAMGLSHGYNTNLTFEQAEPVLLKALELGCTFWDTAVLYGAGMNEKLLGEFIRKWGCREKVFGKSYYARGCEKRKEDSGKRADAKIVASKCGVKCMGEEEGGVTNSPEHIREYIEGTIQRLGFTPDLYYLHRIDPNTPLEKSIPALDQLRKDGKTKYIGLSECSAETLRKANESKKNFYLCFCHYTNGVG
jgi:aryl-alcohol dehydrogenase-like predicted oxidoreductase